MEPSEQTLPGFCRPSQFFPSEPLPGLFSVSLYEESLTTVMIGALAGGQGSSEPGSLRHPGLDDLSRRFLGGSGVGKSSLPKLLVRDDRFLWGFELTLPFLLSLFGTDGLCERCLKSAPWVSFAFILTSASEGVSVASAWVRERTDSLKLSCVLHNACGTHTAAHAR